jgi:cytochrome c-type biogenesis protein CcmF
MGVTAVVSTYLIVTRLKDMRSDRTLESFVSREAAFLMNNLALLGSAFAVLWGTLFPLLTEGLTGSKVSVGPPFFNQVNIPIGLALLALMGIGPVIAWRKASARNLQKNFLAPVLLGLGSMAVLWVLGTRHTQALLTFGIGIFVLVVIVVEFWKGTRARARIEGESAPTAFIHLIRKNRRRWGGYIVHVGVVIMFMGFAGAAYDVEVRQSIEPGESITIGSPFGHTYELRYEGLSTAVEPGHMVQWIATLSVERDGVPVGALNTERRLYLAQGQPVTEVGIRSTLMEDLYVILATLDDQVGTGLDPRFHRATFQVLVNPLVPWIWYGGLILALGTLIALWPGGGAPGMQRPQVQGAVAARPTPSLTPEPVQ